MFFQIKAEDKKKAVRSWRRQHGLLLIVAVWESADIPCDCTPLR